MNRVQRIVVLAVSLLTLIVLILALKGVISLPASLQIGPLNIRFYAIAILSGVAVAALMLEKHRKGHQEFSKLELDEALFWALIPGLLFARLWYVIIFWSEYQDNILKAFFVWEGGLSIFGAYAGGIIGTFAYAKSRKLPFVMLLELAFVFVPLAQIIGRFGNFLNQELYGPETNLPWGMYVRETGTYHHPAFLYEQIGNTIVFLLLYRYYKLKGLEGNGRLVAMYMLFYGIVRFVVDIFRNDLRIALGLTIAQLICILMISSGAVYLLYIKNKRRK